MKVKVLNCSGVGLSFPSEEEEEEVTFKGQGLARGHVYLESTEPFPALEVFCAETTLMKALV